jgi:hypothetical protein
MANDNPVSWFNLIDERQQKEVNFARVYAADFKHGTDGHNRLLLIDKMAAMLDEQEQRMNQLETENAQLRALKE